MYVTQCFGFFWSHYHVRHPLLNDDVLLQILQELQSARGLVPVSMTCRLLREACKPFIFAKVIRKVPRPYETYERFIPSTIWPYIRDLTIIDECLDKTVGYQEFLGRRRNGLIFKLLYAEDPYLCGVLCGPWFEHVLQHMPALRTLSLHMRRKLIHGVSWSTLKTILSLPHIDGLVLSGPIFCPAQLPSDNFHLESCSSLTSFRYEVWESRNVYPLGSAEGQALSTVLSWLHNSLETLVLPSEPAPLLAMSAWEWPNLRELRLRGAQWTYPTSPCTILFSNMPRLRILVLELTLPHSDQLWRNKEPIAGGASAQMLSPPELTASSSFPWPELQHMALSHPRVGDGLYDCLPLSVHTLTLSCCPRQFQRHWLEHSFRQYDYATLTSSEMFSVLRRSRLPNLTELELEYDADAGERDMLRYLAVAFPRLRRLTLIRYRLEGESDDVVMVS
ncbi:hypothetical protein BD310DRAFT_827387 [Dichomitus squalens]|uniref:F-box domain-containing protein n=1 Tax=Dichomitus squalens TaxID=114155 RepID=A0A4Q9PKT9_9APHY|nr:hypothetical protein BD310DRAFT_827387 [Dichomitus squalens]